MMRSAVVVAAVSESPPPTSANCASVPGGHHDDLARPVGTPECGDGVRRIDRVARRCGAAAARCARPDRSGARCGRHAGSARSMPRWVWSAKPARRRAGPAGADSVLPTSSSAQISSAISSAARVVYSWRAGDVLIFACAGRRRSVAANVVDRRVVHGGDAHRRAVGRRVHHHSVADVDRRRATRRSSS